MNRYSLKGPYKTETVANSALDRLFSEQMVTEGERPQVEYKTAMQGSRGRGWYITLVDWSDYGALRPQKGTLGERMFPLGPSGSPTAREVEQYGPLGAE